MKVKCPDCQKPYNVGDHLAGKKIRCKGCDKVFLVTSSDDAAVTEKAPPPKARSQRPARDADEPRARRPRADEADADRPRGRATRDDDDDDDPPRRRAGRD